MADQQYKPRRIWLDQSSGVNFTALDKATSPVAEKLGQIIRETHYYPTLCKQPYTRPNSVASSMPLPRMPLPSKEIGKYNCETPSLTSSKSGSIRLTLIKRLTLSVVLCWARFCRFLKQQLRGDST